MSLIEMVNLHVRVSLYQQVSNLSQLKKNQSGCDHQHPEGQGAETAAAHPAAAEGEFF